MKRIVHLDLKGAPLKLSYFEKVLLLAKSWGATGVLLEWEDTFPYSGELERIGSRTNAGGDGLYSDEEVQHILQLAKHIGLEAIQLVQTIGHMEYVLKHPVYQGLREAARSPAVLCPSRPQSQALVRNMLDQALGAQPDAAYLHIGADEVWHTAVCNECQQRALMSRHKAASLYLEHIRDLALFLKQKRPELTVLMWDDMLRPISVDTLIEYGLGGLVQPVVWHYNPSESFNIDPSLWRKYQQVFPCAWAGSAFKGANGSCQILSPVDHYVSNHEAWMREFQNNEGVNFAGIILTGWSRFDHYAALCELLPVSLPSLASCLRTLSNSDETPKVCVASWEAAPAQCGGSRLAQALQGFLLARERGRALLDSDVVTTWLNPWQIEHKYTNPLHLEGIVFGVQSLLTELAALQRDISTHLHAFTGERSSQEWIQSYVTPIVKELTSLHQTADSIARCDAGVKPQREMFDAIE